MEVYYKLLSLDEDYLIDVFNVSLNQLPLKDGSWKINEEDKTLYGYIDYIQDYSSFNHIQKKCMVRN